MKKRLLSLFMVMTMVISLCSSMSITTFAETDFNGWTKITETTTISENGNYYLENDVVGNIIVNENVEAAIDLNGHILKGDGTDSVIINKGKLTIQDSDSTAEHSGDYASLPAGGVITGGKAENGGGIYVASGTTLTVNGVTITGNSATGNGGGIYVASNVNGDNVSNGKATLIGVNLYGNMAENGGAVGMNEYSQLYMNGCIVKNNHATKNGGGIYKPGLIQSTVNGSFEKCVLIDTGITENTAGINGGGVYFKNCVYSCFVAGTLITMADGTTKKIEDIDEGDVVKTFDHESGIVSSSKVYLAFKGDTKVVPFTLVFDNDSSLSIAGCHDILEKSTRKYVTLTEENANDYIGRYFYGEDGQWHKLLNVKKETTSCDYYSIYTAEHQNCFANGFLSVADDVDYLLNIYELDEKLKADEAQLAADIEKYGLVSYEYANEKYGMSSYWFNNAGAKYVFVAIGKKLVTMDYLENLYNPIGDAQIETKEESDEGNGFTSRLSSAMKFAKSMFVTTAYAEENKMTLDSFDAGVLTIGSGTKIIDNKVGTGEDEKDENVYLIDANSTNKSLITLYDDKRTGIDVGVTTATSPTAEYPVQFTTNGTKADEAYFFSDNPNYADKYNNKSTEDKSDDYLELVNTYKINVEDNIANGSVSVDNKKSAYEGETVSVTVTPQKGYVLDTLTVTDKDSGTVTVKDNSFTMPAKDVTVSATFKTAPHEHAWTYELSNENKTITATCEGSGSCDYEIADKSLTISAPANSTYNGNAHDATFGTATSFPGNTTLPTITYEYKATETGTYAKVTDTKKAGYYKASATVGSGTGAKTVYVEYKVAPLKLTVSAPVVTTEKEYDGSTTANVTGGTFTNKVSTDKVTLKADASYGDKHVGTGKTITVTYSISGDDAANYTAPDTNTTDFSGSISPKNLMISGTTVSGKTYDGTKMASATLGEVTEIIGGDKVTVAIDEATFDTKDVGIGKTVNVKYKLTGGDAANYTAPEDESMSADISQKSINVKADDKNSYVGSDLVQLTYTADSLCSGDSFTGELATNANKDVEGNQYSITQNTLSAGSNYSINFTNGTYTVKANVKSGGGVDTYSITGNDTESGKLTFSSKSAAAGKDITITATPDEGYLLEKMTLTDEDGSIVALTKVNETTYTFKMPASNVKVSAIFTKSGKCPQDETCVYAKFNDSDPKAWYHPGVHFCVEKGYMVGVSSERFDPSGTLSRAMIVTMLWRMEGSPVVNYDMSFNDVADEQWYTEAVRWAQSKGVVKGYDEDSFGANDNVTREQLAAILMRYADFKGIDVSKRADLSKFTDIKSISGWAVENIKWANAVGIINGRTETTIVPTGNATRAEAANMVQRFCETILK